MAPKTDFPPVRACLFDMDGLLIDTEDLYTKCINILLARYGRPSLPWSIKAKLQGRPATEANKIFHDWAGLPITPEQYLVEFSALQREHFPSAAPLPGIEALLAGLARTGYWDLVGREEKKTHGAAGATTGATTTQPPGKVHMALATSSTTTNYRLKTSHLAPLFSVFPPERTVLGDDERIPRGRGKPLPDIYLVALGAINATLPPSERPVAPEECLVFEDSVPGVEAGRRAGMRVVWCPHPMLKEEYRGREGEVLAGGTGEAGVGAEEGGAVGEVGDGWGDYLPSLEGFPYERYGIVVPPPEMESEEWMREVREEEAAVRDEGVAVMEEVEVVA